MPLPIQIGAVTQALQRAFGFKGRYTPLLDEIIVPVYVIADPSPAAVVRTAGGHGETLSLINEQYIQLFNPVGSGTIVNVTDAIVQGDVKLGFQVALFDTPAPVLAGQSFFRDTRNRGFPVAKILRDTAQVGLIGDPLSRGSVDGALAQTASWEASAADPRQPLVVLEPGKGVIVQMFGQGGNALMDVSFRWLEVPATETNPLGGLP